MTDNQTEVAVALIALAGVLFGIVFGYRKWKHQVSRDRLGTFEKEQQSVYKTLWSQVENLNVDGRIEPLEDDAFLQRRQEVNAYMLKSGIYVNDRDRMLFNKYLDAVRAFHNAVRSSGREDAETSLGNTDEIPPGLLVAAREIADTQETALDLREAVITRVREMMTGVPTKGRAV